ncbi:MAG: PEP/pyruvate-binding domain-containing protein [bacterium]
MANLKISRISRPYYSNARLYLSVNNRLAQNKQFPVHKFPFSVWYEKDGRPEHLEIRDVDSVYFRNPHSLEARQHLELILDARSGDRGAKQALDERLSRNYGYYAGFDPAKINALYPEDSSYLAPSTAATIYPPEMVSNKGHNLQWLYRSGFPVPDFCIITSQYGKLSWREKPEILNKAMNVLENLTGKKIDDPEDPLIFSVRSDLPENLPGGLMPTYLNIGATEKAMPGLINMYGQEGAYDIRINHLKTLILDADPVRYKHILERLTTPYPKTLNERAGVLAQLENIVANDRFVTFHNSDYHLKHFVDRILQYCVINRDMLGSFVRPTYTTPAIIIQEMVFGKFGSSFSGVLHTRDPQKGKGGQLIIASNAFGEEIMDDKVARKTFTFTSEKNIESDFPGISAVYKNLKGVEENYRSSVTVEITQENGLYGILQIDPTSMSGLAALEVGIDLFNKGIAKRKDLLAIIKPYHLKQLFSDSIVKSDDMKPVASGISVLPMGDVCGRVYFSKEAAMNAKARGEKVILVQENFYPAEIEVTIAMDGLLCFHSAAVHVTEFALTHGIVSLVGVNQEGNVPVIKGNRLMTGNETLLKEGEYAVILSEEQKLYAGEAKSIPSGLALALAGIGELSEKGKALQKKLDIFKAQIQDIPTKEIGDMKTLGNLATLLVFFKDIEGACKVVNSYFGQCRSDFLEYFINTPIGKHKGRLDLFRLLSGENQKEIIKALAMLVTKVSASRNVGVFILGRIFKALKEQKGEPAYQRFIGGLSDKEKIVINNEIQKADEYLKISQVPQKDIKAKPKKDVLWDTVRQQLGDKKFNALTDEEKAFIEEQWNLDPDPEHKPAKVIKRILGI